MVEPVWISALSQILIHFPALCIMCVSGALSSVAVPMKKMRMKTVDRVTERVCLLELTIICHTMPMLHKPGTLA